MKVSGSIRLDPLMGLLVDLRRWVSVRPGGGSVGVRAVTTAAGLLKRDVRDLGVEDRFPGVWVAYRPRVLAAASISGSGIESMARFTGWGGSVDREARLSA